MVLLQTGIETLCATWFCLKCAPFVKKRQKTLKLFKAVVDKTCKRQRARPCCCLKLAPNHTAQLSFCFKLARIVTKVKFEKNTMRIFPVARNWVSKHSAQLSFCLQLACFVKQPDKIFLLFDL